MNLTIKEVAARLGVARSTVYALVKEQRIGHLRLGVSGGAIHIPAALADYVAGASVDTEPQSEIEQPDDLDSL